MTFSSWGRNLGIEVKSPISLQYAECIVKSDAVVYSGRPVTISNGELVPVITNVKALGLAKFNKNSYINEVIGAFGMYGSGRGTVIISGIVDVSPNYFVQSDGSEISVANYTNDVIGAAEMSPLYIVTDGADAGKLTTVLVTNGAGQNDATKIGYLLVAPSATNPIAKILLTI